MGTLKKFFLACALTLSAFFCGPVHAGKPLKIASVDMVLNDLLFSYAEKEGFFSAEGLSVERMTVAKGPVSLLVSGQADMTVSNMAPVLAAYQNGADLKVLACIYPRFELYAASRFKPEEGYKVKTIVHSTSGGAPRLLMDPFLDYLKVDRQSLKTVIAPGDAAHYTMLEMGYADLTDISSPELLDKIRAEKKYYLIPLAATGKTGDPHLIVASGSVFRKRGAEVKKVTAAFYSAIKAAAADKEKVLKYMKEEFKYSPGAAAQFYDNFAAAVRDMDYVPSAARLDAVSVKLNDDGFKAVKDYKDLVYPDYALSAVLASYKSPFVK